MEYAPAPWTGALFTVPGAPAPAQPGAMRVRRWSLQVGRGGITLSTITEQFGPPPAAVRTGARRPGFGLATAAVAGGLALLLAGATAGRAWAPAALPADAAMLVPTATPFVAAPKPRVAPPRRFHRAVAPPAAILDASSAAPGALSRNEAITRAVRTGEFQEWTDGDGVTGFAVPGVAEVGAAGACRTLAVLARRPDGTDQVSSSKVCAPVTTQD